MSALIGYAADKLIEQTERVVKTQVIERWSRHRANVFFEEFCSCLLDVSVSESDVQAKLDQLTTDETLSAIVFDAYRSVCLTKSRTLGPRIIAILTAELVIASRFSDFDDDLIFSASEEMNDDELEELSKYTTSILENFQSNSSNKPKKYPDGSVEILIDSEIFDSNYMTDRKKSVGPLDLKEYFGTWALKAKRLGLLSDDMQEEQRRYEEDSERHIDMSGTERRISWTVSLSPACIRLGSLTKIAGRD